MMIHLSSFRYGFSQIIKLGIVEPSAMSLATADENEIGIRHSAPQTFR